MGGKSDAIPCPTGGEQALASLPAELSVADIAHAGDDVAAVVQVRVDDTEINLNIGLRFNGCKQNNATTPLYWGTEYSTSHRLPGFNWVSQSWAIGWPEPSSSVMT